MSDPPEELAGLGHTTLHLRRAQDGDESSLSWLVAHLTPFVRAQAEYRLQGGLRRLHDPDDLVNEVWMVVLPKLGELRERDGHGAPVLLKFLATTLLHRLNNHLTRHLRRGDVRLPSPASMDASEAGAPAPPHPATSLLGSVQRNEAVDLLRRALAGLDPEDRELLVLRAIEQHPNQEVARRLGVDPSTATRRYQRLLERLRPSLPAALADDLRR